VLCVDAPVLGKLDVLFPLSVALKD
jgi:hypothetical protein